MRVLIFHGYLLRGTGSNVYNAELAQAFARLGHEVHLLCQDRAAGSLGWVDATGSWRDGELVVERLRGPEGPGSVTAYTPEIGGVLPLYVADTYEGFEARPFPDLSEAEVESYLEANVAAVRDVAERAGAPDAALANHLVMGPAILARAGVGSYAAKVHGSALEYTVKPHPRFLPYAREGMEGASAVLVGSRHTAESLWAALPELGLEERTRLGPPGLDPRAIHPRPREEAAAALTALARSAGGDDVTAFGRDGSRAAEGLEWFSRAPGPRVVFVGKLIVSKGIDLLLAAWPLVRAAHPAAELLVAGFGEFDDGARQMLAALDSGNMDGLREVAARGRGLEGADDAPLPILSAFVADLPAGYPDAAREVGSSVGFTGRLEHSEVATVMPFADAVVMPSTFPEAFGMVAAEAAASGALPVSAGHSGMLEVSRALAPALPEGLRELLSFEVAPGAVEAIADRLDRWLALPRGAREEAGAALAERASSLWSWEGVATGVIDASRGRLADLPAVPAE